MAKKENYKKQGDDLNKKIFNSTIGRIAHGLKNKTAIILDTEKLNTKRELVRAGFRINNIHIPNPFSYKLLKRRHKHSYNLLLGEFIESTVYRPELKHQIGIGVFDYCCSFNGNKEINPMEDIQAYFGSKLPADNSFLVVTLCWRNGNGTPSPFYDMIRLTSLVSKTAAKHKYIATLETSSRTYKGGMFYLIFKLSCFSPRPHRRSNWEKLIRGDC